MYVVCIGVVEQILLKRKILTPLPPSFIPRSPWSDKYDTIDHNRYSEPIRTFVSSHLSQLKSEAVVYSHDEYLTWDQRSQPQCSVAEVGRRRKGLTANANIPEDELVLEYMVSKGLLILGDAC